MSDGSAANSQACACGSTDCQDQGALVCDASEGTCSNSDCTADINNLDQQATNTSNCARRNSRCECVQCGPGYYTDDCSVPCPQPFIAIIVDVLLVSMFLWIFLAYLYYTYRYGEHTNADSSASGGEVAEVGSNFASSHVVQASRRQAQRLLTRQAHTLRRLLVGHMQIFSTILASLRWSPDMPAFVVTIFNFLGTIFTLDVPGVLSSMDCAAAGGAGKPVAPLIKWYARMIMPVLVLGMFWLWFRLAGCWGGRDVNRSSPNATQLTVLEASVQVVFVWLFTNVLTTCFRIFDCTKGLGGRLIMDPNIECGVDAEYTAPVVLGGIMLFCYLVVPNAVLYYNLTVVGEEDHMFRIKYGWATEDYKDDGIMLRRVWEVVNTFTRVVMVAGSTIMFRENRLLTHTITMSLFLALLVSVRPYKETTCNKVAIMFGAGDLLGVLSNRYATLPLQVLFCIVMLATLAVLLTIAVRNMRTRLGMEWGKGTDQGPARRYTLLERRLLAPVLVVAWLIDKVLELLVQKCCRRFETEKTLSQDHAKQRLRVRLAQLRGVNAIASCSTPDTRTVVGENIASVRGTPSQRFGDKGRTDSYVSRNVVEMAEMAAEQRRDSILERRAGANQRLRDRLRQRQGLAPLSATKIQPSSTAKSITTSTTTAATSLAREEAIMTSHRVQVEARRASNMHSQRTKERRKTSDQRLAERLAARNKVKSSRCLQKSSAFASLEDAFVSQIVDVMQYSTNKLSLIHI